MPRVSQSAERWLHVNINISVLISLNRFGAAMNEKALEVTLRRLFK